MPPIDELTPRIAHALPPNQRRRAEVLVAVSDGVFTPAQVVEMASRRSGKQLGSIHLHRLLSVAPGWTNAQADRALRMMLTVCGADPEKCRDITVSWVLNPKAIGARTLALADVIRTHERSTGETGRESFGADAESPWPGFPYTARPQS